MGGELHKYFLNNSGLKLHKWLHYFDIYERHFSRFRNLNVTMLEIGVSGGGSLRMWKEYLGPQVRVIGLDIDPKCKAFDDDKTEVFVGSQDDTSVLDSILEKYPSIDIVLDDGGHKMKQMRTSFSHLYPRISPTGVYAVEDTHTCYRPRYQGGLKREGSFLEFVKDRIDDLHVVHTNGELPVSLFTRSTDQIAIYDSIVVFERRPQGKRQAPITEAMSGAS